MPDWLKSTCGAIPLVITGGMSVALVIVVGLLIGLLQFQTRLLRLQPLGMQDIVFIYETQELLKQNTFNSLAKSASNYAAAHAKMSVLSNEIDQRVQRICRVIASSPSIIDDCEGFLKRIPFDYPAKPASVMNAFGSVLRLLNQDRCAGGYLPAGLGTAELALIKRSFVSFIEKQKIALANAENQKAPADPDSSDIIGLYDLGIIACKNQDLLLSIGPQAAAAQANYARACSYQLELLSVLQVYGQLKSGGGGDCAELIASLGAGPPSSLSAATLGRQGLSPRGGPSRAGGVVSTAARLIPLTPSGSSPPPPPAPGTATPPPPAPGTATPPPPVARTATAAPPPPAIGSTTAPPTPADLARPQIELGAGGTIPPSQSGTNQSTDPSLSLSERQRLFELVSSYAFYESLTGKVFSQLLLSPSEFLALMLVTSGGILGAVLRIVFVSYETGKTPRLQSFFIGPVLGLICALVVFVLFRAGFIALTDHTSQNAEISTISPFVVALMSIAAGMLSKQSIEKFRRASSDWFGSEGEKGRYAVHLRSEMEKHPNLTVDVLAAQLNVNSSVLEAWIDEREPVPIEKQHDIAMILGVQVRQIFSDLGPSTDQS